MSDSRGVAKEPLLQTANCLATNDVGTSAVVVVQASPNRALFTGALVQSKTVCTFLGVMLLVLFASLVTQPHVLLPSPLRSPPPLKPYLYISFHGAASNESHRGSVNQVLRYEIDKGGLAIPAGPVLDTESIEFGGREYRGMTLDEHGRLFIASAYRGNSFILEFSSVGSNGQRRYMRSFSHPDVVHPYGVALLNDHIYTTTQDAGMIYGFDMGGALVAQIGGPRRKESYRGIAVANGCVYAAEMQHNKIFEVCNHTITDTMHVTHPVSVVAHKNRLYVGSAAHRNSCIYVFSLPEKKPIMQIRHDKLLHPSGIAFHGNSMYVAAQGRGPGKGHKQVVEFDVESGDFVRVLLREDQLPDVPEAMLLVWS